MATKLEKRLEQIENALIAIGAGGVGFKIGQQGAKQTAIRGGQLALRNPTLSGGLLLVALQRAGVTDTVIDELLDRGLRNPTPGFGPGAIEDFADFSGGNIASMAASNIVSVAKPVKKRVSKFNKAVKSGMAAVRKSKSYGKPGTINNAKKAFSAVTKVASKVNRGKKVAVKGVTGTIARAVRKIL